jgi:hypothetical protein
LFLVIFIRINESRITGHSLGAKICCIYFTALDFEGRNSLPLLAKKLASFFFFFLLMWKEQKLIHYIALKIKMNDLLFWGIEMFSFHQAL